MAVSKWKRDIKRFMSRHPDSRLAGGRSKAVKAPTPKKIQKKHKWIPPRGTILGEGWK